MWGFGIVLIPMSWHFGPWNMDKKWLFAIGPLRLVWHKKIEGTWGGSRGDG